MHTVEDKPQRREEEEEKEEEEEEKQGKKRETILLVIKCNVRKPVSTREGQEEEKKEVE